MGADGLDIVTPLSDDDPASPATSIDRTFVPWRPTTVYSEVTDDSTELLSRGRWGNFGSRLIKWQNGNIANKQNQFRGPQTEESEEEATSKLRRWNSRQSATSRYDAGVRL